MGVQHGGMDGAGVGRRVKIKGVWRGQGGSVCVRRFWYFAVGNQERVPYVLTRSGRDDNSLVVHGFEAATSIVFLLLLLACI